MSRTWYVAYATPSVFGSAVARYRDTFDFVDAVAALNARYTGGAVILFIHEIDDGQYTRFAQSLVELGESATPPGVRLVRPPRGGAKH